MKKSKSSSIVKLDSTKTDEYYQEAAVDALLYWVNTTIATSGANTTLTLLTEILGTCLVNLVPEDQIDRAESTVMHLLEEAFDILRSGKQTAVSEPKGDLN
jgi:hypothetical protein